jgi:DHA2 family multidrug resistance protein
MVNSSIADLQGTVHASADEASWISTAYSMAEIAVIPVTAMLLQVLGLRRLMIWLCGAFMATSLLSAAAPSLGAEIALRAVQGAGWCLRCGRVRNDVPRVWPAGRAFGLMLLTFCQTFPANIGALLAGWITESPFGWPAVYYLEIGLTAVILVEILISAEHQCGIVNLSAYGTEPGNFPARRAPLQ